jgi:hypothetical protein
VDNSNPLEQLEGMVDQYLKDLGEYKPRKRFGPQQRKVLEQFLVVNEDTPREVWSRLSRTGSELKYKQVDRLAVQLEKIKFLEKTSRIDKKDRRNVYYRLTEFGLFFLFSHSSYITNLGMPAIDIVNVVNAHRDAGLFRVVLLSLFSRDTVERLTQSLRTLLIGWIQDMAVHIERGLLEFQQNKDDPNTRAGVVTGLSMVIAWNVFSFFIHYSALFQQHPENIRLFAGDNQLYGIIKAIQQRYNQFVDKIEYERKEGSKK